jgi:hypothetical protein
LTQAINCATEALMLGSLMMLVSGSRVRRPSSARLSGTFCASVRYSGEFGQDAGRHRDVAGVDDSMPAGAVKVRMMGRNA